MCLYRQLCTLLACASLSSSLIAEPAPQTQDTPDAHPGANQQTEQTEQTESPTKQQMLNSCQDIYFEPAQAPAESPAQNGSLPVHISGKRLEADLKAEVYMVEDARLQQGNQEAAGAQLSYDLKTGQALLTGQVTYRKPGLLLTGDQALFDNQKQQVKLESASYTFQKNATTNFQGEASLVQYQDNTLIVKNAWLTSCRRERPGWSISAREIHIQRDKGQGRAKHIVLRAGRLPVLYLPWLGFPATNERQSGFLTPSAGLRNVGGLDLAIPYYLNLAPNYDATFTPRWVTRRGLLMAVQFRQLTQQMSNEWLGAYIPNDQLFNGSLSKNQFVSSAEQKNFQPADRWRVEWRHKGQWGDFVRTQVIYTKISDHNYFRDFGGALNDSNQSDLSQSARLDFKRAGWVASLATQGFQQLDSGVQQPYNQLPAFTIAWQSTKERSLLLGLQSALTRFDRNTQGLEGLDALTGDRLRVEPRLTYKTTPAYGGLQVDLAYRYNRYAITDHANSARKSNTNVGSALFGARGHLVFERFGQYFGHRYLQTLEPHIYYLWSEYSSGQDQLPVFDSGTQSFGFSQMFQENRFSGYDRISDANQLTLGLTNRWFGLASGQERAGFRLGSIVRFSNQRVNLAPLSPGKQNNRWSPLVTRWWWNPSSAWRLSTSWKYDISAKKTSGLRTSLRFRKSTEKILNLRYRRQGTQGTIDQTRISAYWPLPAGFYFAGAWRYDFTIKRNTETLAGLEYKGCCWRARIAWRSFLSDIGNGQTQTDRGLFLQVALKGLGRIGSGSGNLYSRTIDGFREEDNW